MSFSSKLRDFLDSHGINYSIGKQSFITDCISPMCGKPKHMYIRKKDGQSICFKCGTKWNWKRLISAVSKCELKDAYSIFWGLGAGDEINKTLELEFELEPSDKEEEIKKVFWSKPMPIDFIPYNKSSRAMDYLYKRGVTNINLLNKFDVRYNAGMDAVVFPILSLSESMGYLLGWQARKIEPKENEPKVITMPGFDKSKFLLNYLNSSCFKEKVILVEGPFDCIHADVINGFGAVASLGKHVSQDQIEMLLNSDVKEIYIGLDNDAAEQVYEVVNQLGLHKKCFRIKPPEHRGDFGECTPEEMKESLDNALLTTSLFLEVYLKEL